MIHIKIGNMEATMDTPEELEDVVCRLSRIVTYKEMASIARLDERTIRRWGERDGAFPPAPVKLWQFIGYLHGPPTDQRPAPGLRTL